MTVHVLPANQPPERFYRGGARIAGFRHRPVSSDRVPEDWVGSTTALFGEEALGLSALPDGASLAAAIAADPERWLGEDHARAWGADTRLLVKLLDAGQRLPVHAHPNAAFARAHLGHRHGKTEAWHILAGGEVFLGLRETVDDEELREAVERQRVDDLLGLLHRRVVAPGDTVYVPAGTLHAIGEGVFLVEVQEPEDLSILLEWRGYDLDGAAEGHLGLGFPLALTAVTHAPLAPTQVDALVVGPDAAQRLPPAAAAFFRLERRRLHTGDTIDPGYAVVVALDGRARLRRDDGVHALRAGDTAVIEHRGGALRVEGDLEAVVLRPPVPPAAA